MDGYTYDKAGNRTKMTISHPDTYQYKYTRFGAEQTVDNVKNHVVRYSYNDNNQLLRTSEILTGEKGFYEAVGRW